MSSEWRPRIRVSRKRPVTRKGNVIVVVCKTDEDAEAVSSFLETMFEAAKRDEEKKKTIMDQIKLEAQVTALVGAELKDGEQLDGTSGIDAIESGEIIPLEDLGNTPPEAL